MTVYRTEYYERKLDRWISFWESTSSEEAIQYLDTPVAGHPEKRVASYEKSGVRKIKYKFQKAIKYSA